MKLTITTPTYTYQPAAVLRAEGRWEECRHLFDDPRLEACGALLRAWADECMAWQLEGHADNDGFLAHLLMRQEVITRDRIKCVIELDWWDDINE